LERSFALRDGAVSAAKVERFDDALRLFDKAIESLRSVSDREPLVAGLIVETALVLWRAGKKAEAILRAADALDAVGEFAPNDRQAERSHQYARAIAGLFFSELDDESRSRRPPFGFGQASALELKTAKLQGVDLKPLADNWRILAAVEGALSDDLTIDARS